MVTAIYSLSSDCSDEVAIGELLGLVEWLRLRDLPVLKMVASLNLLLKWLTHVIVGWRGLVELGPL